MCLSPLLYEILPSNDAGLVAGWDFKLSLLAIGLAAGAYWSKFFLQYLTLLIVIGVVAGVYMLVVWWKQ